MSLLETLTHSDAQLVEVSGWDEKETFFVETADLNWDDFAGKHIALQHKVTNGAMVFVRVLDCAGSGQTQPSVYRVEFVGCNLEGQNEFRLNAVRPRYSTEDHSVN
jgi:hypothetical protein